MNRVRAVLPHSTEPKASMVTIVNVDRRAWQDPLELQLRSMSSIIGMLQWPIKRGRNTEKILATCESEESRQSLRVTFPKDHQRVEQCSREVFEGYKYDKYRCNDFFPPNCLLLQIPLSKIDECLSANSNEYLAKVLMDVCSNLEKNHGRLLAVIRYYWASVDELSIESVWRAIYADLSGDGLMRSKNIITIILECIKDYDDWVLEALALHRVANSDASNLIRFFWGCTCS